MTIDHKILLARTSLVVHNHPVKELVFSEKWSLAPATKDPGRNRRRMTTDDAQLAELEAQFHDDGVAYLLVQFVDIHGAPKVKLIPVTAFRSAVQAGAGFAGGAVWGMGQGPHSHDMLARADTATYTPLPYESGVARFAADLHVDDRPHPFCPRVNLKRVLARAREQGYVFNVGIEPEF